MRPVATPDRLASRTSSGPAARRDYRERVPRRPPPSSPDLPPELAAAIAAMDLDELRAATGQLLEFAGARPRRPAAPDPVRRRRRRSPQPFSVTVRVDLVDAKPPVWRRLELPSTLRLDELHGVLQAVFGWTDSHLHRFSLGDSAWDDQAERFLCPYDVEEGEDDGAPTWDVRLDEVLAQPGDRLLYTYDYGDEGNHRLVVEQVGEPVEAPRCTGGRGAAPPEDSGGIGDWDAGAAPPFDLAEAQAALALWEVERALPPEITSCCGTWRCCRRRRSSAIWSRRLTSAGRSPWTRPRPAMRCSATFGCCTGSATGYRSPPRAGCRPSSSLRRWTRCSRRTGGSASATART
jgi:hypothetical protein